MFYKFYRWCATLENNENVFANESKFTLSLKLKIYELL